MRSLLYLLCYIYVCFGEDETFRNQANNDHNVRQTMRIMHKETAGRVQSGSDTQFGENRDTGPKKRFINAQNIRDKYQTRSQRMMIQKSDKSIAVDPLLVDLDNFQSFNDISEMNMDEEFLATPPPPFIPVTVEDDLLEHSFSEKDMSTTNIPIMTTSVKSNDYEDQALELFESSVTPSTMTSTMQSIVSEVTVPTEIGSSFSGSSDDDNSQLTTARFEEMTTRTTVPTSSIYFPPDSIPIQPSTSDDMTKQNIGKLHNFENLDAQPDPSASKSDFSSSQSEVEDVMRNELPSLPVPTVATIAEETTANPLWWTPRPAFVGQTSMKLFQSNVKLTQNNFPKPVVLPNSTHKQSAKRLFQWGRTQPYNEQSPKYRIRDNKAFGTNPLEMKKTLSGRTNHVITPTIPVADSGSLSETVFAPHLEKSQIISGKTSSIEEEDEILNELQSLASKVRLDDLSAVFEKRRKQYDYSRWNQVNMNNELVSKRNALRQLELLKNVHEQQIMQNLPNATTPKNHEKAIPKDIDEVDIALRELGILADKGAGYERNIDVISAKPLYYKKGFSRHSLSEFNSRYKIHKMNSGIQIVERQAEPKTLVQSFGYTGRKLKTKNRKPKAFMAVAPTSPRRFFSVPGTNTLPDQDELKSVEQIVHSLKRRDESNSVCDYARCSFESGDLCNWESSYDETTKKKRAKRAAEEPIDEKFYVMRSWSNWIGHPNSSPMSVDRAPVFLDSNKHFAGIVLSPQQRGSLTLRLVHEPPFKIRFRGYDIKPATKLKVCCDNTCFVSNHDTEQHRWRKLQVDCPANTTQISFECISGGQYRGACGVDEVSLHSSICNK